MNEQRELIPPVLKNRYVWAASLLGTILAVVAFLIVNTIEQRVTTIESVLPCETVKIGEDVPRSEISPACKKITRKRVEAISPEDACKIIEKAESQLIFSDPRSNEVFLIDVRCPDESQ